MIPPIGSYFAKTTIIPGPRAEFIIGQRACGWLGIDYAGKPIAQLMLSGTCMEVRVTRGSFKDDELVLLCNGLGVPYGQRDHSPPQCFAHSTYYARHPHAAHGFLVPSSLWAADVSNFGLPHCAFPVWSDAASAPASAPRRLGKLLLDSYGVLNGDGSAATEHDGPAEQREPMETFALFVDNNRDSMAWVRWVRAVGPQQELPRWPPEPGAYPCEVPVQRIESPWKEYTVFTAHVTVHNGPHCASLRKRVLTPADDGVIVYIHATPRPGLDVDTFLEMVECVMKS